MPLRKIPKTFCQSLEGDVAEKTFFPYNLLKPDLQPIDYFPSPEDYEYEKMKVAEKSAFDEWYSVETGF